MSEEIRGNLVTYYLIGTVFYFILAPVIAFVYFFRYKIFRRKKTQKIIHHITLVLEILCTIGMLFLFHLIIEHKLPLDVNFVYPIFFTLGQLIVIGYFIAQYFLKSSGSNLVAQNTQSNLVTRSNFALSIFFIVFSFCRWFLVGMVFRGAMNQEKQRRINIRRQLKAGKTYVSHVSDPYDTQETKLSHTTH